MKEHIRSFPAVELHYCRQKTNKQYLSEHLNIKEMYRRYKEWMKEKVGIKMATEHCYREIFNHDFNIEFHKPRKDLCDHCTAFSYLNEEQKKDVQALHDVHIKNRDIARDLLEKSIKKAEGNESIVVACFDVQKNLMTPKSEASAMYYKRKISVYNFTIYNLLTHEGMCHLWNPTISGKGANEISSIL